MEKRKALTEADIAFAVGDGVKGAPFIILRDGGTQGVTGLALKARATGMHSWTYNYRLRGSGKHGTVQTATIGKWPAVTLKAARAAAREMAGAVALGSDPQADKRAAREADRMKVSAALDRYEKSLERRKYKNQQTVMSSLRRNLAPLESKPVADVTLFKLVELIDDLEEAGKLGAADFFRKSATTFLKWCAGRGFIPSNPLAGYIRDKATGFEKRARAAQHGRALTDDEIVRVWVAAEKHGTFGALVRFGLLTGLRRNELAGLTWDEVRSDRIVLPDTRTKTSEPHQVALTAATQEILTQQRARRANDGAAADMVFASAHGADNGQISGWTKLMARLRTDSDVEFTLHDLRRTFRTLLARLNVPVDIAELCIAHKRNAFELIYNKDDAWRERVEATKKASELILSIVAKGRRGFAL